MLRRCKKARPGLCRIDHGRRNVSESFASHIHFIFPPPRIFVFFLSAFRFSLVRFLHLCFSFSPFLSFCSFVKTLFLLFLILPFSELTSVEIQKLQTPKLSQFEIRNCGYVRLLLIILLLFLVTEKVIIFLQDQFYYPDVARHRLFLAKQ